MNYIYQYIAHHYIIIIMFTRLPVSRPSTNTIFKINILLIVGLNRKVRKSKMINFAEVKKISNIILYLYKIICRHNFFEVLLFYYTSKIR